jgi:hypothetical protein
VADQPTWPAVESRRSKGRGGVALELGSKHVHVDAGMREAVEE